MLVVVGPVGVRVVAVVIVVVPFVCGGGMPVPVATRVVVALVKVGSTIVVVVFAPPSGVQFGLVNGAEPFSGYTMQLFGVSVLIKCTQSKDDLLARAGCITDQVVCFETW